MEMFTRGGRDVTDIVPSNDRLGKGKLKETYYSAS